MKQNESYIAEKYYDQQYEQVYGRSEDVHSQVCPSCKGTGDEEISSCCGAPIEYESECSDCESLCNVEYDKCSECNGTGEI